MSIASVSSPSSAAIVLRVLEAAQRLVAYYQESSQLDPNDAQGLRDSVLPSHAERGVSRASDDLWAAVCDMNRMFASEEHCAVLALLEHHLGPRVTLN